MTTRRIGFGLIALFLLFAAATPGEVRAEDEAECTDDYLLCLNEAVQTGSPEEELKSVECGAEWVGCVAGKLRFW